MYNPSSQLGLTPGAPTSRVCSGKLQYKASRRLLYQKPPQLLLSMRSSSGSTQSSLRMSKLHTPSQRAVTTAADSGYFKNQSSFLNHGYWISQSVRQREASHNCLATTDIYKYIINSQFLALADCKHIVCLKFKVHKTLIKSSTDHLIMTVGFQEEK